ncbi:MAG: RNase adapter RapZ [Bacteroidota bacterium]|nr:RNase adapter RapZ [Bacteroidota bacterium]
MELLSYYLDEMKANGIEPGEHFRQYFFGFAFLRLMQVLGAYGYRGIIQNKSHFMISIPFAVDALQELYLKAKPAVQLDEMSAVFEQIFQLEFPQDVENDKNKLTVSIHSFSYKKGLPRDYSGNGGGYVFDCRALPNPGRMAKFRSLTGLENPVSEYLKKKPEVESFVNNCTNMVKQSIKNYLARGFSNLSVSFGCTGGQHRSVYCANKLLNELKSTGDIRVLIEHRELKD